MTVEEIEIIVTAKVEEALKEFEKFLPTIKQVMKQAQESVSKKYQSIIVASKKTISKFEKEF